MTDGLDEWLVEIRVVKWSPNFILGDSVVTYEEVLAKDEKDALKQAYRQFVTRCTYEPVLRRRMKTRGLDAMRDCSATDAVQLT